MPEQAGAQKRVRQGAPAQDMYVAQLQACATIWPRWSAIRARCIQGHNEQAGMRRACGREAPCINARLSSAARDEQAQQREGRGCTQCEYACRTRAKQVLLARARAGARRALARRAWGFASNLSARGA